MFDEESEDGACPIMLNLTVDLKFQKTGQVVRERITIKTDEGVFGNEEVMARMIIKELNELGEETTVVAEGDMPLQAWIGRLLAVFRETTLDNKKSSSVPASKLLPESEQIDYDNYIFKRK